MAINGPSSAYEIEMESTPVSGVEIRKAVVALFDAPARRNPTAAGITPQEHKGKGIPKTAAFTAGHKPLPVS
jgi:hypothetical protein